MLLFVHHTAPIARYLLSLHNALPLSSTLFPYTTLFRSRSGYYESHSHLGLRARPQREDSADFARAPLEFPEDRKSTSELQSPDHLVCRLLLEKKKIHKINHIICITNIRYYIS